jgi:hypothetical protein
MAKSANVSRAYGSNALERVSQQVNDSLVSYQKARWAASASLAVMYAYRVMKLRGFYLVTYALGIFFLQKLVAFVAPKADSDGDGPSLPRLETEEFKPFQRKLPEYKFWRAITGGVTCAHLAACFRLLDVPVYWPILLAYWLLLFFVTMRKQVSHMWKHKYLPFTNLWKKSRSLSPEYRGSRSKSNRR